MPVIVICTDFCHIEFSELPMVQLLHLQSYINAMNDPDDPNVCVTTDTHRVRRYTAQSLNINLLVIKLLV